MVAKAKKGKIPAVNKSQLLFSVGKEVPKWYANDTSDKVPLISAKHLPEVYKKDQCEQIYRSECDLYQSIYQQEQESDYQWLQTSMSTASKVCSNDRLIIR